MVSGNFVYRGRLKKQRGALTGETTLNLPVGAYEVEEMDALRYEGKIIEISGNVKKIGALQVEATLGSDDTPETVTYTNQKSWWDRFSHNDLVINQLKESERR